VTSSCIALSFLGRYLDGRLAQHQHDTPHELYRLPPKELLKAMSLGYSELGADLLWVRTISYFGDHLTADRKLPHLKRYLHAILSFDEHFKAIYRYGSAMLMSQGPQKENEVVWTAIDLLERAHRFFPDDYMFPLHLGAYYMSELRNPNKAIRARWRRIGAEWVHRAALIGTNMPWLPSLAANIYNEQGQRDLAIQHLEELYLTTQDEKMKQQITSKLLHLKVEKLSDDLHRFSKRFNERYSTSTLSFVPADLFVLVDAPDLPPFRLQDVLTASRENADHDTR